MRDWEKHFQEFTGSWRQVVEEIKNSKPKLQFNRSFVKASDVAQQYYCEKKLEMEYVHGRVETEEKLLGTEAHEKLLEDTVRIKRKKLWQKIYGKTPVSVHEMLLLGKHKGTILAGQPDSVLFANGVPLFVFEYKFSKSNRVYDSYQVQARIYGILLKCSGFDIGRLFNAIVVADPAAKDDVQLKYRVAREVAKNGPEEAVLSIDGANIYLSKFDTAKAEQDLDWALSFWKKKREAVSTNNPNKCRVCEFKEKCSAL